MVQSASFPIFKEILKLESIVGRLSPVQKMLLGTDGSVTSLLEVITQSPVEIETIVQKVVIDGLTSADIPIGVILKKHRIESRRDITSTAILPAGQEHCQAFGGFLIDGGHSYGPGREKMSFSPSSACGGVRPASVTVRHDFPMDWKIILALPDIAAGAHGKREADIFQEHCPLPAAEVHELCYQILVRMVPSLVERDLDGFGAAVNRVQEIGFKKIEVMMQHPVVHKLMAHMLEAGAACSGLSSFGPAVYAITDTQERDIEAAAREAMRGVGGEVLITSARNEGARVRMA